MKHATSRNLFAYWNRRRGGRAAPDRHDIEPYDLGADLIDTFLIRLERNGDVQYRFCGSSIAMAYGRDLTNEDFLARWEDADRQSLRQHIDKMIADATGFVAGTVAETASGGFATYELLVLPLLNDGQCDRAIGCMGRVGGHAPTNRIKCRIINQSLRSVRLLAARDEGATAPLTRDLPPPPQPDQSVVRKRFGHLVLVQGGR